MGRPSAVLWDVQGTLVLRTVSAVEMGLRALIAAGVSPLSLRSESIESARQFEKIANLRWRTMEQEAEGFRAMAAALLEGVEPPPTPEQVARVAAVFAAYDDMYRLVPGVLDLLTDLQARRIRQAVVSNWPPSLRRFLDHHDLSRFFSVVVCSAEEGVVKPDPGLFRLALSRLGLSPAEAIYVGDHVETDIVPATGLGMDAIHFDPGGSEGSADARDAASLRRLLFARLGLTAAVE